MNPARCPNPSRERMNYSASAVSCAELVAITAPEDVQVENYRCVYELRKSAAGKRR